jgi:hypothetical protein
VTWTWAPSRVPTQTGLAANKEYIAMKKHTHRQRPLVLHKETLQLLASTELTAVVGGAPWSAGPTACPLTVKTCASFEFAC